MTRLFVSIELSDEIKEKIKKMKYNFPDSILRAKFTTKNNMHITLKFIGEKPYDDINDIIEAINKSCNDISQFEIDYKKVGAFPNSRNPKIIWVGCSSPRMLELSKNIDTNFATIGIAKETRPFSPHITIARVKEVYNKQKTNDIIVSLKDTVLGKDKVNKIYLKKSVLTPNGPMYSDEKVFKL